MGIFSRIGAIFDKIDFKIVTRERITIETVYLRLTLFSTHGVIFKTY